MPRFFISHAADDAQHLAQPLTNLLQLGCGLRPNEIFCASVEGSSISAGTRFTDEILEAVQGADLVILLVTHMWWDRPFCIAEAGGAWALGKTIFPLVVSDLPRELGANMLGTQTRRLDEAGLSELRDRIIKIHPEAATSTPRWMLELRLFIDALPDRLAALRRPDTVTRAEFTASQEAAATALEMVREARTEIERLTQLNDELRAARNADDVRAIERRHSTVSETYDALVAEARERLRHLANTEQRCLFATVVGRPWRPSPEMWNFEKRAMEAMVAGGRAHDAGEGWVADLDDPIMEEAHEAITELGTFLDEHQDELAPEIRAEHRVKASLDNTRFWEEVLGASFIE